MAYKKFKNKDLLYNFLDLNPKVKFDIYDSKLYLNDEADSPAELGTRIKSVPSGYVSLYELNIDRPPPPDPLLPAIERIRPLYMKTSDSDRPTSISKTTWDDFAVGDVITGTYPLSASITRDVLTNSSDLRFNALKNTIEYYSVVSREYLNFSSFSFSTASMISIPSIFYGSSIEKGSINLKFYVSGTLIGHLKDENRNGHLIEVVGPRPGSTAGLALYNEGFLFLTGNYSLDAHMENYDGSKNPSWIYYGMGANDNTPAGTIPSSSFSLDFQGENKLSTFTMFTHAGKGEMNHSNNPTYVSHGQARSYISGAYVYEEPESLKIKNIVKSPYADPTGSFEKVTYISKIGIYDKDKNLIGVASVSKPLKKTPERNYTFKLKLDI